MCFSCHQGLSDDNILNQLKNALSDPQFHQWNTTSFNHIKLAIMGLNGEECHDLAVQLAEQFYVWFLGPTNGLWQHFYSYNPCLESFPHSDVIREDINDAINFYEANKGTTKEELMQVIDP